MVVSTKTLIFHCPACGWTQTVQSSGDVLMPGVSFFERCPSCGHAPLQVREASLAERLAANVRRVFAD